MAKRLKKKRCPTCKKMFQPKTGKQKYCSQACQRKHGKKNAGRPTVMTPECINKLEKAFAIGCTDLEACCYADISHTALYEYQKEHPEFTERKERLKETPVMKARTAVFGNLQNPDFAFKFLERKRRKEFAPSTGLHDGEGEPLKIRVTLNEDI